MARPSAPRGLHAVRVALATTDAGAPRGRRRLGLLLLVAMPVLVKLLVLAVAGAGRGQGFPQYADLVTRAYLTIIVPLTMVFLGTAVFGDEWAGGTSHYVVGVPLPRDRLVVGRWLAAVRRGLFFVLPSLTAAYLVCLVGLGDAVFHYLDQLGWVLAITTLLAGAYSALFLFLGLALRRSVMTSLIYVFLFELITASLPQAFAALSLGFHGRNLLWQLTENDRFRLTTLEVGLVEPLSVTTSTAVIVGVTLAALFLATVMLVYKESGSEGAASDAAAT